MTSEDINHKIGALHLRLLDNPEQYQIMLKHLLHYAGDNYAMGEDVNAALEEGLKNHQRIAGIENALSPRFIRIEKRELPAGQVIHDTDTEGLYHVVLGFDDGFCQPIHFEKKQDQLLYIMIVLCSLKNGLLSDFFQKQETQIREVVSQFIDMIYPNARTNGAKNSIMTNLSPKVYFSDIIQKLKAPIEACASSHGTTDELLWFLPYTRNYGLKRIHQMRMLPVSIHYPPEFQPIVDALPDAADYVDMSSSMEGELKGFENIDKSQMHTVMLKKANEGDIEAMNIIAGNYNWGTGVLKDKDKAFGWWKKAADLGHDESQFYVGVMYGTGDVVQQDYKKAAEYLKKAASQNYADAIYWLGKFKRHGFGCRKNPTKAIEFFERAAELGCQEAAIDVAWMFYHGEGIRSQPKKALHYYFELAKHDIDQAYWHIIESYLKGRGLEQDEEKAIEWMEKGIDKGMLCIYWITGFYFYNNHYYDEASIIFKEAAEQGIGVYEYLAKMNMKGVGQLSGTREETIEWLTKGVLNDDDDCKKIMKKMFPEEYKALGQRRELSIRNSMVLKLALDSVCSDEEKLKFLKLVDSYREVYRDRYQEEINKQLSIHQPSTDKKEGKTRSRRKIMIRKLKGGKQRYELVLRLINGEEVIISKMNPNSLLLFLLAVICSYKSGYTTIMADEKYADECVPVFKKLIYLVLGNRNDVEIQIFIESFLRNGSYYRTYSNMAKNAIKQAVGLKDEALYYLFDNFKVKDGSRKNLRRMIMDVQDIELPDELMALANQMPDGKKLAQNTDNRIYKE